MTIRLADDRRLLYFYVADVGPVGGQVWTDSSLGRDAVVHGQIPITGKEGDPSELLTEREIRVLRLLRGVTTVARDRRRALAVAEHDQGLWRRAGVAPGDGAASG